MKKFEKIKKYTKVTIFTVLSVLIFASSIQISAAASFVATNAVAGKYANVDVTENNNEPPATVENEPNNEVARPERDASDYQEPKQWQLSILDGISGQIEMLLLLTKGAWGISGVTLSASEALSKLFAGETVLVPSLAGVATAARQPFTLPAALLPVLKALNKWLPVVTAFMTFFLYLGQGYSFGRAFITAIIPFGISFAISALTASLPLVGQVLAFFANSVVQIVTPIALDFLFDKMGFN